MPTIRKLLESGKITLDTVVLGEPAITKDGVLVGINCDSDIYIWSSRCNRAVSVDGWPHWCGSVQYDYAGDGEYWNHAKVSDCYSTREAAEAAKEKA